MAKINTIEINQDTYFSLSKGQIKEIIHDFYQHKLQIKWDNGTSGRKMYDISHIVGVYPTWEQGSRKCTTIMAQLRSKHNFLNDTKGRLYKYVNPNCGSCGEVECDEHFLYDCKRFVQQRSILITELQSIYIILNHENNNNWC